MRLLHLQEQGKGHLFIAKFPNWGEVPFKLPSITRARQYSAALILSETSSDKVTFNEYLFRECVVDKELAFNDDIPAGIVESISQVILYLSGIQDNMIQYTEELFSTFRSQTGDPVLFMKRIICSVFSGYTFESLGELDYQSLTELFINAEVMMLEAGLVSEPYSFSSPEESKKPRLPRIPMGPAGPGKMSPDNVRTTTNGSIDLDALINDGKKMQREENAMPAKVAYNLHDDPAYKAKKEAHLARLEKLNGR
jgi:hypothetical protein